MISFCTHFLHAERLHIYRQVTGIRAFENWVVTRHRLNSHEFPYPRLHVLKKSRLRFLTRLRRRHPVRWPPLERFELGQLEVLVRDRAAVLVHAYFGTEAIRLLPFLERTACARIVSFHGYDATPAALPDEDLQRLSHHVDLLLCRSASLAEQLVGRGCPHDRVRLNPTGVPIPAGSARTVPAVSERRPFRMLQACRFVAKKGLDVSLRALALLRQAGIPVTLTLAGDGPEEPTLRRLTEELSLGAWVRLVGFLPYPALVREFDAHDAFVHPSRPAPSGDLEGIPNSLLEAMAHGLPVVSTHHGGIPEAIVDGEHGLLLREATPELLAGAVRRLIADQALYARLSTDGRRRIETGYSVDAAVRTLEARYEEAVALARMRASR